MRNWAELWEEICRQVRRSEKTNPKKRQPFQLEIKKVSSTVWRRRWIESI